LAGNDSEPQSIMTELIGLAPGVLVVNGSAILRAAQQATKFVPIVFVNVVDPVGQGFIQSLEHPDGNITGLSNVGFEMGEKWLRDRLHRVWSRLQSLVRNTGRHCRDREDNSSVGRFAWGDGNSI
jgi:hypothetical protein